MLNAFLANLLRHKVKQMKLGIFSISRDDVSPSVVKSLVGQVCDRQHQHVALRTIKASLLVRMPFVAKRYIFLQYVNDVTATS